MSQIGPYLSQKRPNTRRRLLADWRHLHPRRQLKGNTMSRSTTKWLAIASLTLATLTSAACTRSDATGPSESTAPSFETQGANN